MEKVQKDELISLCRIKVNKMLSTLNNNNKNIFKPTYTLTNRNQSKYFYNSNKINKKQKPKIISENINNINSINYKKAKPDFIINHGVLVYQKNMKGEEIINFGINKNKINGNRISNNNAIYKTQTDFHKKIKKKIKTDNSKKTIHFSLKDTSLNNKNIYNKENIENINFNYNEKNLINTSKQKSYVHYKSKPKEAKNKIPKIKYLITKIKKIFNKKIKSVFNILNYLCFENYDLNLDTETILINDKKSNSIYVNKRLTSNTISSRSNSHFKNLSSLISKNFQFFSKNSKEKELYRDSKSLEKKYEQICRRKKLNMTMTFTDSFKKNIFSNENKNFLSERNNNSYTNFIDNNNSLYTLCTNTNRIRYNEITLQSPDIINKDIKQKINTHSFRENSINKINLIENNYSKNKINKRIEKYLSKEKRKSQINKYYFHSIKNICTNDKRIYIHINYLPYIIKNKNKKIDLNISKTFEFNYISKKRKKPRKRFLTLIKEEEESKVLNSFKKNNIINNKCFKKKNTSNIIIKDKIYMNNIFINNNNDLFRTFSLDFADNFNVINSSSLKSFKKGSN